MIKSLKSFGEIIGYSIEELDELLLTKNLEKNYYHFTKKEKRPNGQVKKRPISPSKSSLKDIHNRLVTRVFHKINFPAHVQGSIIGRSYVTNALAHIDKLHKFKTDIVNFFGFVTNKKVNEALINNGFSPQVAYYITRLTTYQGHLPQGTPTSSYLANLVGLEFDKPILELCTKHEITFTRYVDDLVFSSNQDFQSLSLEFLEKIREKGFVISHKKTVYKKGSLEITGANVNKDLQPTVKQLIKRNNPEISDSSKKGLDLHFKRLKDATKPYTASTSTTT